MAVPRWSVAIPALAVLVLALSYGRDRGAVSLLIVGGSLIAAVVAAVRHAEVVAQNHVLRFRPPVRAVPWPRWPHSQRSASSYPR